MKRLFSYIKNINTISSNHHENENIVVSTLHTNCCFTLYIWSNRRFYFLFNISLSSVKDDFSESISLFAQWKQWTKYWINNNQTISMCAHYKPYCIWYLLTSGNYFLCIRSHTLQQIKMESSHSLEYFHYLLFE